MTIVSMASSESSSASEDSYELEYELEIVHVSHKSNDNDGTLERTLSLRVLTVVPPSLEYMSQLHNKQQEISSRKVWSGSMILARSLPMIEQAKRDLDNKRCILELGTGTGILGMATAIHFKPKYMVMTDGDSLAINVLVENLQDTYNEQVNESSITITSQLLWGQNVSDCFLELCKSHDLWAGEEKEGKFDAIVAGDVLYKEDLPLLFFQTVNALLSNSGSLWLCHVPRSTVTHDIVTQAADDACLRWKCVPLPSQLHLQDLDENDVKRAKIYCMTKIANELL